jgi:pentatricopeptide repeat protein
MQRGDPDVPRPDLISFNAAISACEKGGQWEKSLELLKHMKSPASGITPDVITYNATISSCEKGAQWQRALALLTEMRSVGLHPNVVTFSAAISACEKGGQWQEALGLLNQMGQAKIVPDSIAYRAAIVACGKSGQWQQADRLYVKAVGDGIMNECGQSTEQGQEGGLTLELSGAPAAVVVAALRHTLFALVEKQKTKASATKEVQDLYLKTESTNGPASKKKKKKAVQSPYPIVSRVEVSDILKTFRPHPLHAEAVTDNLMKISKTDLSCWLEKFGSQRPMAVSATM